jgi:phage shock protein A
MIEQVKDLKATIAAREAELAPVDSEYRRLRAAQADLCGKIAEVSGKIEAIKRAQSAEVEEMATGHTSPSLDSDLFSQEIALTEKKKSMQAALQTLSENIDGVEKTVIRLEDQISSVTCKCWRLIAMHETEQLKESLRRVAIAYLGDHRNGIDIDRFNEQAFKMLTVPVPGEDAEGVRQEMWSKYC